MKTEIFMKKLSILGLLLIAVSFVSADMDIVIAPDSGGGDINTWVYPNSGIGETNYYMDGKNFDQEIERLDKQDIHDGIDYYFYSLRSVFMEEQNPGSRIFNPVKFNSLNREQQKYRFVMENWFVTYDKLTEVIKQQQLQITQLNYEVNALQHMFTEEALCKVKLQVVKEFNLTSVNCGNTTYYNHLAGDKLVGLTEIEVPIQVIPAESQPISLPRKAYVSNETIARWTALCEKGLDAFCLAISNYYN